MAVAREIIDLLVCRKIHGCGCVADDPASCTAGTFGTMLEDNACVTDVQGFNMMGQILG